jgi:hypothetical protein
MELGLSPRTRVGGITPDGAMLWLSLFANYLTCCDRMDGYGGTLMAHSIDALGSTELLREFLSRRCPDLISPTLA